MEIPLSPLCRGSGAPKTTKDQGVRHGGRLGSQLCRWRLLNSASLEDCLTTKEWFELACDGEIHCREQCGCL